MFIPKTVRDWQIYDYKGSTLAAYRLTKAMEQTLAAIMPLIDVPRFRHNQCEGDLIAVIMPVYKKIMVIALDKESRYGTSDSEPRGVAAQCVIDAVKAKLGVSRGVYWGELGDALYYCHLWNA